VLKIYDAKVKSALGISLGILTDVKAGRTRASLDRRRRRLFFTTWTRVPDLGRDRSHYRDGVSGLAMED